MTMAAELFKQFQIYWQAGIDARLNLECHAGKVWMNLQINLPHPPPPPPPPYGQHQQHKRPRQSPSRLRRRARRAEARAAAAKAAASVATEDVAVQTESDVQHHHQVQAAEEVPDVLCPDQVYQHLQTAAQAVPPPPPRQTILPQLDGHADEEDDDWINPDPVTGFWICRCCEYAHSYMTEDDLRQHHDTLTMFKYEECNICYPWHVWS